MKKLANQVSKKETSGSQTIYFFFRFDPDTAGKTNFQNTLLIHRFFKGAKKPLALYPPFLEKLSDRAFGGDSNAAKSLVQLAIHLSVGIARLKKQQPGVMSGIARSLNVWPVVTDNQPAAYVEMLARLDGLGLGRGIRHIDPRFRKARGCDDNHAARRWAKAAVLCVTQTRFLQGQLVLSEKKAAAKMQSGLWKRGDEPPWVSKTKDLPDFSQTPTTQTQWADVIRQMIRQQMPDFQSRPEWNNQRNSCKKRGRDTNGVMQNTILDDIVSALKTIAPDEISQPAESLIPNFST
jgi:hypothetical protein